MVPNVSHLNGHHTATEPSLVQHGLATKTDVTFPSIVLGQLTVAFLQGSDLVLTHFRYHHYLESFSFLEDMHSGPVCEVEVDVG